MQGSYGRVCVFLGRARSRHPVVAAVRATAGSIVRQTAQSGSRAVHTNTRPLCIAARLSEPVGAPRTPGSHVRSTGLTPPVWRKVAERDCRDGQFSRDWFYPQHVDVGVPVILRGAANEWPAVRKWSLDYLADHGADTRVTVSLSNEEVEASVKDQSMTLSQYIRAVLGSPQTRDGGMPARQMPYLKQMNLLAQFPVLGRDLLCASLMSESTRWSKTFCWMGPAGAVTGTHNDDENNISVQIIGRKRFLLVPPQERGLLYPNKKYDPGTGCCCDVSMDQPDLEKHPLFAHASVHEAVLEPGDVLFVPVHWYHHVRCLTPCVSVNYFGSRPLEMLREGSRRGMRQVLHRVGLLGKNNCVCCAAPQSTPPSAVDAGLAGRTLADA